MGRVCVVWWLGSGTEETNLGEKGVRNPRMRTGLGTKRIRRIFRVPTESSEGQVVYR